MNDNPVTVNSYIIESTMKYHNEQMLHYKINYPKFISDHYQKELNRINAYYKMNAMEQQKIYEDQLFFDAIKQFNDSKANNFPFHMYEAIVNFEITYNKNCTISLYTDRYEYTGGAHGSTVRTSETWSTKNGNRIKLWQNFNYYLNDRAYVIDMIYKQIEEQINSGNNMYFDDYHKLVVKNFNPDNYYLTSEGIVIYFQQYDIAPYASGIPEFILPYSSHEVIQPNCRY